MNTVQVSGVESGPYSRHILLDWGFHNDSHQVCGGLHSEDIVWWKSLANRKYMKINTNKLLTYF